MTTAVARTRLTPELTAKIMEVVVQGGRFADACLLNGVTPGVGNGWLARGRGQIPDRPASKPFRDFAVAHDRALAQHRIKCKLNIRQAAQGGAVIARKQTRETRPDGTVVEESEERRTPPNYKAALVDLRLEHPVEYPEPDHALHLKHGLDETTATLLEQLKAVNARAHDPRALPPGVDVEVVDAEVIEEPTSVVKRPVTAPPEEP